MKTLEFIYQETQIHFLLNPTDDNVMVNATEMAKLFDKRVDDFTRLTSTESYINVLLQDLNSKNNHADVRDYNKEDVINSSKKRGTYMHRLLALKFAAWLDVKFELWIFSTIEAIIFGPLKEYKDLLQKEVLLKSDQQTLKNNLIDNPCKENVDAYFLNEAFIKAIKAKKRKVVNYQLSLFEQSLELTEMSANS